MIRCPVCNQLLYRRNISGVELDGCPSCGGFWADRGELQRLARDASTLVAAGNVFQPNLQPAIAPERTGRCPRCSEPLKPFEYKTMRGVQLDRCSKCEGVWVDHGEADLLAARLAPAAAGGAPANAAAGEPLRTEMLEPAAASPAVSARFSAAAASAAIPADPTSTAELPLVRGAPLALNHLDTGFFASLERGLRFVAAAYRLAWQSPVLLAPMLIGAVLQVALFTVAAVAAFAVLGGATAARANAGFQLWLGAEGLVTLFLSQLINMTVLGMTVNMVDAWLKGLTPSVGTAARDVNKNLGALAALAAIGTLVEMLTSQARNNRRSLLAGMLSSAISTLWTVLSFLLVPIIIVEDVGLGRALSRAREIHRRGLLQIAVGEVGLRAVAGIASMAVIAIGAVMLLLLGTPTLLKVAVVAAFVVPLLLAVALLNAFARGAYYTCLYHWAHELERAGVNAPALVPEPLATVLVR